MAKSYIRPIFFSGLDHVNHVIESRGSNIYQNYD